MPPADGSGVAHGATSSVCGRASRFVLKTADPEALRSGRNGYGSPTVTDAAEVPAEAEGRLHRRGERAAEGRGGEMEEVDLFALMIDALESPTFQARRRAVRSGSAPTAEALQ